MDDVSLDPVPLNTVLFLVLKKTEVWKLLVAAALQFPSHFHNFSTQLCELQ